MRLLFLIPLTLLLQPAAADVFRCIGKQGAVAYQPSPCSVTTTQQQLDIAADPDKEATAKARLSEVRGEYATRKEAQFKAERLASEQSRKAAAQEVAKSRVFALQELAAAKRLQAENIQHKPHRQPKPNHRGAKHGLHKFW